VKRQGELRKKKRRKYITERERIMLRGKERRQKQVREDDLCEGNIHEKVRI